MPTGGGTLERPNSFFVDANQLVLLSESNSSTYLYDPWIGSLYDQSIQQISTDVTFPSYSHSEFSIGLLGEHVIEQTADDKLVSVPLRGGPASILAQGLEGRQRGFKSPSGEKLFFAGRNVFGWELWVTEGTENTTHFIDLWQGTNSGLDGDRGGLGFVGEDFIFAGRSSSDLSSDALWKTDGSSAPPTRIRGDFNASVSESTAEFNGRLYFLGGDRNGGSSFFSTDLWSTDGTAAGTSKVFPGRAIRFQYVNNDLFVFMDGTSSIQNEYDYALLRI